MPLLSEFAITPDVLDSACYESSEVGDLYCKLLKKTLLEEDGLVRDLRNKAWSDLVVHQTRLWHPKWKELVKKLKSQNRFISFPPTANPVPTCDDDWCREALASDAAFPLTGVIANRVLASRFASSPKVASIAALDTKQWWTSRSASLRLRRNLDEYTAALSLLLRHARSVMFIDAHLNPAEAAYREFSTLLQSAASRNPPPKIEIHRVCYQGDKRTCRSSTDWENDFRSSMAPHLRTAGLAVEIFIWDDFHDRHIISDLAGFHLGNGLKTTRANDITTWTRHGRDARDDIQREFDPGSRKHYLHHRFAVP